MKPGDIIRTKNGVCGILLEIIGRINYSIDSQAYNNWEILLSGKIIELDEAEFQLIK
tara:strand:+ start:549 stop:719 length:171 start_codon:yes stop_codon:yes gene_type:complete